MIEPTGHPTPTDGATDPSQLAAEIMALARPVLIVFDCDGVLAPITDHADNATLNDGVRPLIDRLARADGVIVAVLSGRSLAGLSQFDFDESISVAGSYGSERRGRDHPPLTADETRLLNLLDSMATDAAAQAGPGAWVERKLTSVVLHVREADRTAGRRAIEALRRRHRELGTGPTPHDGAHVLELMVRPSNKGDGLDDLRREFAPASTVFLGDDIPDEDAFARLDGRDLGVKVGPGPTRATRRLADADAVVELLELLVTRSGPAGTK